MSLAESTHSACSRSSSRLCQACAKGDSMNPAAKIGARFIRHHRGRELTQRRSTRSLPNSASRVISNSRLERRTPTEFAALDPLLPLHLPPTRCFPIAQVALAFTGIGANRFAPTISRPYSGSSFRGSTPLMRIRDKSRYRASFPAYHSQLPIDAHPKRMIPRTIGITSTRSGEQRSAAFRDQVPRTKIGFPVLSTSPRRRSSRRRRPRFVSSRAEKETPQKGTG